MPRADKVEKVAELKGRIDASDALLLTEFTGLTVADATELRRSLAEAGARFAVVKNTLMKRAAEEAGMAQLEAALEGPTAAVFVMGDPVAAAKRVVDAARRFPALVLKGGFMEGRVLTAEETQRLATLDSREAMLAKVAGMAGAEMHRAAYLLQALQGRFLAVLGAFREKTGRSEEGAGPGSPPAEEPSAEEPSPEETSPEETETEMSAPQEEEEPSSGEEGKE